MNLNINIYSPKFYGCPKIKDCTDLRTPLQRAMEKLNDEKIAALESIRSMYDGSPLRMEAALNRVYEIFNRKALLLEERYSPKNIDMRRLMKKY